MDGSALQATPTRIELVRNLSRAIPIRLVEEYFGFPGPDIETLMRWSRAAQFDNFHNHHFHQRANSATIHSAAETAKTEMRDYIVNLIKRRGQELATDPPPDDVLARLLRTKFPESVGFGLPEIVVNTIGLLIGAVETTSHAVIHAFDQLLNRPTYLETARTLATAGNIEAFDLVIWEALRFAPISPYLFRQSATDYTLASAGTDSEFTIRAGETVLAVTLSAMFDETVVERPFEFRPDRRQHDNFDFGHGLHRCVGEYLGRAMIPEIIRGILTHGLPRRADREDGRIDYGDGPFPERLTIEFA